MTLLKALILLTELELIVFWCAVCLPSRNPAKRLAMYGNAVESSPKEIEVLR